MRVLLDKVPVTRFVLDFADKLRLVNDLASSVLCILRVRVQVGVVSPTKVGYM